MKLHGDITINNRVYRAGTDVSWFAIYPFFLVHAPKSPMSCFRWRSARRAGSPAGAAEGEERGHFRRRKLLLILDTSD